MAKTAISVHIQQILQTLPVRGVGHVDVPGRELQDLPSGPDPAVRVGFDLLEIGGQAVVGVLWCWRDVELQLGCGRGNRSINHSNQKTNRKRMHK